MNVLILEGKKRMKITNTEKNTINMKTERNNKKELQNRNVANTCIVN